MDLKTVSCILPVAAAILCAGCARSTRHGGDAAEDVPAESEDTVADIEAWDAAGDAEPEGNDAPDAEEAPADMEDDEGECSPIGGPCVNDGDCCAPEGLPPVCMTDIIILQFPGGYCMAECNEEGDCGPGAECVDFSFIKYCLGTCSTASECREDEGYICDIIPYISDPNTYCIPAT
jgi:hypothetical protein